MDDLTDDERADLIRLRAAREKRRARAKAYAARPAVMARARQASAEAYQLVRAARLALAENIPIADALERIKAAALRSKQ